MKKTIFQLYLAYKTKFPIDKGKSFVGRTLTKWFGSFNVVNAKGLMLEVFPNSIMDLSYFENQDLSHDITLLEIENLSEGETFVDIGANIGYFSLLASKKVGKSGKVYAVEPSYREYRRLIGNIMSNKSENIVAFNVAVGRETGFIPLSVAASHTGLNKIDVHNQTGETIIVPIFKFENIYNSNTEIALVKIDVEGAEFQVLEGMKSLLERKAVQKFVIEITPKFLAEFGNSKEQVYNLMHHYGYGHKFNLDEWQYDEVFEKNSAV